MYSVLGVLSVRVVAAEREGNGGWAGVGMSAGVGQPNVSRFSLSYDATISY